MALESEQISVWIPAIPWISLSRLISELIHSAQIETVYLLFLALTEPSGQLHPLNLKALNGNLYQ